MLKLAEFEAAGRKLNASISTVLASKSTKTFLNSANQSMLQVERNWLNPEGIPGRPWFKHMLYGARFTYAHLELPGLTEAAEAKNWPVAQQQLDLLVQAIRKNTELLQSALCGL